MVTNIEKLLIAATDLTLFFGAESYAMLSMAAESSILGPPPWSVEALEAAYLRDFGKTWETIRQHPGCAVHTEVQGLRVVLRILEQSVEDFGAIVSEFHQEAHYGRLFNRPDRQRFDKLELKVRKNVFCAAQAAMALVDHTRRLARKIEINGYQQRVETEFAHSPDHRFLQDLRNHLAHIRMVEPQWQLSDSRQEGRKTRFLLKPEQLLESEEWHDLSKAFIADHPEGVSLEEFFRAYLGKVLHFHRWFLDALHAIVGRQIEEYLGYERCLKAAGARMWWNLILRQVVIQSDRDPYVYLERYLTKAELEEVYALPMRSRPQVDKIIDCVDEYQCCNDELRRTVYEAFKVTEP